MDEILDQYYEDLLRVQFRVSDKLIRNQHLSCGTIREDFLKDILAKKKASIKIDKGFVKKGNIKSGECDLIFHHLDAPVDNIGGLVFIEPKYVRLVLEVKSNASGGDFKKTNENFEKVKSLDSDVQPKCGMFCYNTLLKKKSILNRFGWSYDKDLRSWYPDQKLETFYSNIDFVICIASNAGKRHREEQQFFLTKDEVSKGFELLQGPPIIKKFFSITNDL